MSSYQPTTPLEPGKKKTSPLVWILVGCGGLVLISVIGVLVVVGFFWNKAKEIQDNPAMFTAKLIAAANPDVEVVSVDENAQVITFKEKSTGKTVTVSLKDAQDGKVSFSAQGEEGQVTFEAKGGESTGGFEVKSDKGSFKFGSGAANMPEWLPSYPGSSPQGTYSAQDDEGSKMAFSFNTGDSVQDVLRFYEDALKDAGLRIKANTVHSSGVSSTGTLVAENSDKKRMVAIAALSADNGTQVTISLETKD